MVAPTKASSPEGNGYDIYDLYDLGEFETYGGDNKSKATKWGTKEEYINAIEEAKKVRPPLSLSVDWMILMSRD